MSDIEKTAMEKLAADPKAQAAAKIISKLAFNSYMGRVQSTLNKSAEAEEVPEVPAELKAPVEPVVPAEPGEPAAEPGAMPSEEEAIMMVAEMIQEDPDSVPDEVKAEFIEAIMGDPELEAAVEQEVKVGMKREMYKRAFYDQANREQAGQPSREMYKAAFYKRAQEDQIRKTAEELAMDSTPEGQPVDPEMIEAIIEIIQEQSEPGGGMIDGEMAPDEELAEEELTPEIIAEALGQGGNPIIEGDGQEVIASKVASLVQGNIDAGRPKIARSIYNAYFAE